MLSCQTNADDIPSVVYDINPDDCCNDGLMDYIKVHKLGLLLSIFIVSFKG